MWIDCESDALCGIDGEGLGIGQRKSLQPNAADPNLDGRRLTDKVRFLHSILIKNLLLT